MKLYLIRHGQTTGDVKNLYGGDYDDHLTELGRKQAADCAKSLSDRGIDVISTSPKIRATETAEIISQTLGVPIKTVTDFRERNSYGILTGMNKDQAARLHPTEVQQLKDVHNTVTGGEPYDSFKSRILSALTSISKRPYTTAALVTHGGPISLIFRELLDRDNIAIDDCAWALLDLTSHLPKLLDSGGITL